MATRGPFRWSGGRPFLGECRETRCSRPSARCRTHAPTTSALAAGGTAMGGFEPFAVEDAFACERAADGRGVCALGPSRTDGAQIDRNALRRAACPPSARGRHGRPAATLAGAASTAWPPARRWKVASEPDRAAPSSFCKVYDRPEPMHQGAARARRARPLLARRECLENERSAWHADEGPARPRALA
jgi:hypothetical protein